MYTVASFDERTNTVGVVFSILSDFICAGFPILLLWDVQISKRTKVALCMLMGLGVM